MTTVLLVISVVGGMPREASALIVNTRDSSSFQAAGITQYEGDAIPGSGAYSGYATTADISNWTVGGGNLTIVNKTSPTENWFGLTNDPFTWSTGYTIEARFRVSEVNGSGPGIGAFNIGSGASVNDDTPLFGIRISADGLRNEPGGFTTVLYSGDMTQLHTVRVAVIGGASTAHLYVDGVQITDSVANAQLYHLSRLLFGDDSSYNSGSLETDYLRVDTTGAFAPVPVPEPTSMSLMCIGSIGYIVARRRK